MGFRRPACACALALAACGDNRGTTTESGTRLRLNWLEYDDGTRQLASYEPWDEARDETCAAQRWTDGNTYCTPTQSASLFPHYTDAECTTAEYLAESPEPPTYVARFEDVAGEQQLASLARPEPATLAMYWELDGEECRGPYASAGRMFYRAGSEVSRSDLARLRTQESTGDGRVGVRATTSSDGLYLPIAFVDRHLHSPCTLDPYSTTEASCIPSGSGDLQYRDAACTQPVLAAGDAEVDPPPAIVIGSTCVPRVFAVGRETAEAPAYVRVAGDCLASTQGGSPWFTLIEHPVALVPRTREVVAGRRLAPIVMSVDGIRVAARQLFDTEIGEECFRATSPREPGVYRCVPRDVGFVVDGFSDAACTIPIEVGLVYVGENRVSCTGAPLPRFARDFGGATIIRELSGPRSVVYVRDGAGCQPDLDAGYRYHDLGAAIPDDRWARATIVRE